MLKNKITKQLTSLILLLLLSFSFAIPTYAVNDKTWESKFASLANVSKTKSNPGCVRILQRFMLCYHSTTYALMYNDDETPIDGVFGENTYQAVRFLQTHENIKPIDGDCGPLTWTAVAQNLNETVNASTVNGSVTTFYSLSGSHIPNGPVVKCFQTYDRYDYHHYDTLGSMNNSISYTQYY